MEQNSAAKGIDNYVVPCPNVTQATMILLMSVFVTVKAQ